MSVWYAQQDIRVLYLRVGVVRAWDSCVVGTVQATATGRQPPPPSPGNNTISSPRFPGNARASMGLALFLHRPLSLLLPSTGFIPFAHRKLRFVIFFFFQPSTPNTKLAVVPVQKPMLLCLPRGTCPSDVVIYYIRIIIIIL